MFPGFLHIVARVSTSFLLWLNIIPLYGYTTFTDHATVDYSLDCFHFFAIMNNAAVNIVY